MPIIIQPSRNAAIVTLFAAFLLRIQSFSYHNYIYTLLPVLLVDIASRKCEQVTSADKFCKFRQFCAKSPCSCRHCWP